MSDSIKYVRTGEENGCVIACLAMITGKTFKQVIAEMRPYWDNEGMFEGTDDDAWMQYLAAHGYAYNYISDDYTPQDRLLKNWPVAPFAPIHICFVHASGPHAVIMSSTGEIFDPNDNKIKSLTEYHRVYRIVGIWKVTEKMELL
jgi:hypothetical protein